MRTESSHSFRYLIIGKFFHRSLITLYALSLASLPSSTYLWSRAPEDFLIYFALTPSTAFLFHKRSTQKVAYRSIPGSHVLIIHRNDCKLHKSISLNQHQIYSQLPGPLELLQSLNGHLIEGEVYLDIYMPYIQIFKLLK